MDPASIAGIIGTAITITQVVDKCITRLNILRAKYKDADLSISTLTGQLSFAGSTLKRLERLIRSGSARGPRFSELASDTELALDTCDALMSSLNERIDQLERKKEGWLSLRGKALYLWSENGMKDYLMQLGVQINALSLLLNIFQLEKPEEQQAILEEDSSLTVLRLARDCSSSLRGVDSDRRSSMQSFFTENTNSLSLEFAFDCELLGTRAYQKASKSNLRKLFDKTNPKIHGNRTSESTDADSDRTERRTPDVKHETLPAEVTSEFLEAETRYYIQDEPNKLIEGFVEDVDGPGESIEVAGSHPQDGVPKRMKRSASDHPGDPIKRTNSMINMNAEPTTQKSECDQDCVIFEEKDIYVEHHTIDSPPYAPRPMVLPRAYRTSSACETQPTVIPECTNKIKSQLLPARGTQRVLLLGASSSGKSTLFKSIQFELSSNRFRKVCYDASRVDVLNNIEHVMMGLDAWVIGRRAIGSVLESALVEEISYACKEYKSSKSLSRGVAEVLSALWSHHHHTLLWRREAEGLPSDGLLAYWGRNVYRVADEEYSPTMEDILRCQVPTSGIHHKSFKYCGLKWTFVDVGGRHTERWKVVPVHPVSTSIVVYTVSVVCFDGERPNLTDRFEDRFLMRSQLEIFDGAVNSGTFPDKPLLIVFTKVDELAPKLQSVSATTTFPDYDGGDDPDAFKGFIARKFVSLIRDETREVRVVFTAISDSVNTPGKIVLEAAKALIMIVLIGLWLQNIYIQVRRGNEGFEEGQRLSYDQRENLHSSGRSTQLEGWTTKSNSNSAKTK